jgi:hypothetical protein
MVPRLTVSVPQYSPNYSPPTQSFGSSIAINSASNEPGAYTGE